MNNNRDVELLKVFLNTKGDFRSTNPVPFMNKGIILFTTKVFLDTKVLEGNNIKIKNVFTNYDEYTKAYNILQSENYSTYTLEDIQKNNIEVFRRVFLSDKTEIPVGNKKVRIITSTYAPNSFKRYLGNDVTLPKKTIIYEVKFDVTILDSVRNLTDEDFKRASCKTKAGDLNKQAQALFGIDLGLDATFPPIKRTTITNPYANSNPYANQSLYSNNINNTNTEMSKARREISILLKELYKEEELKLKEKHTTEWLNYKEQRNAEGLAVVSMNDWIAERERNIFEKKYKTEWLKYKQQQDVAGKPVDLDKWRKSKLEEEFVNESDLYSRKWLSFRNNIGSDKRISMIDWLKTELKKNKRNNVNDEYSDYIGGNKYNLWSKAKTNKAKRKRSKAKYKSTKKSTKNKSTKNKSTKNKHKRKNKIIIK